jgi:hypothetical protein
VRFSAEKSPVGAVLRSFTASVERIKNDDWKISNTKVRMVQFDIVSAGAYISDESSTPTDIFMRCDCDMVFALYPDTTSGKWNFRIFANTPKANAIKTYILRKLTEGDDNILNPL